MNRIILIIAAIAAGYAVGKRCARVRYAPEVPGYWVHDHDTGEINFIPADQISYVRSLS